MVITSRTRNIRKLWLLCPLIIRIESSFAGGSHHQNLRLLARFSCQVAREYKFNTLSGEMSEWSKVRLSKSRVPHGTVGSNPTLSVRKHRPKRH